MTTALQWNPGLSVGIDLIDEQHRMWIRHLNDVAAALASGLGPTQIGTTLGFLIDYTEFHFATEERHMTLTQYPGLAEHRQQHAALKATLGDLVRDFEEEGATTALADAVHNLLGAWLVTHIREVDRQFGAFLKTRGMTLDSSCGSSQA